MWSEGQVAHIIQRVNDCDVHKNWGNPSSEKFVGSLLNVEKVLISINITSLFL